MDKSGIEVDLSIIIVNYNAKRLIGQCVASVKKAATRINHEIIIIDNNSADGSKEYLPATFKEVTFIFNNENAGYAKACNQGFKISSGNYILFLNPDTTLSETCLADGISFLKTHDEAGAIGVRMLDAKGKFLKESKRGIPSPATSFYKLFGATALFPHSGTFAKYYQGHLPEKENNPVEVLSGAFMMIKREAFEKVKGFDEDFFMYGEDIDLSVRLNQSGYKNYYLGNIRITHQKGGSTTYNYKYVQDFYAAMKLFVKKHYSHKPSWYLLLLNSGINIRKMMAAVALLFR
ncbi:MAG TPA: glycosyltransferase family 2 protein [Chitinophagaceae bacterium]|nr:glycosyltransferase family 2 protein [Chitinophagaceae bacterium]